MLGIEPSASCTVGMNYQLSYDPNLALPFAFLPALIWDWAQGRVGILITPRIYTFVSLKGTPQPRLTPFTLTRFQCEQDGADFCSDIQGMGRHRSELGCILKVLQSSLGETLTF